MKAQMFCIVAAGFFAIGAVNCESAKAAVPPGSEASALKAHIRQFLDAYAADDQKTASNMIDPERFTMFGSDVAEIAHGAAGLKQLMEADHRLWHTAKFGTIEHFDSRVGANYASAFFDVPFSAGGGPTLTLRVSTVWHKRSDQWLLTQSSNCVPTVGSSARELLSKQAPGKS